MNDKQHLLATQLAVDLVCSKLKVINELPEGERECLRKLVGQISMLPSRYKTGSVTSYFKEKYANVFRYQILDKIVEDPEHRTIFVSAIQMGKSRETIRQMLTQGFQYLRERMDTPEGKYAKLREKVEIGLAPGGVAVEWKSDQLITRTLEHTGPESDHWRVRLDKFIEEARDGLTLELDFSLNEVELEMLRQELSDISDKFVPLHISSRKLKLQCSAVLAAHLYGN